MIIIFMLLLGRSNSSRPSSETTTVFKVKPTSEDYYYYRGHFTDFLPRHLHLIPTSGPSRRHNDIGLQAWGPP
ncbi:hypothetical protein LINGRAHAP2_LOCUS11918 [Linum grandiflorum]